MALAEYCSPKLRRRNFSLTRRLKGMARTVPFPLLASPKWIRSFALQPLQASTLAWMHLPLRVSMQMRRNCQRHQVPLVMLGLQMDVLLMVVASSPVGDEYVDELLDDKAAADKELVRKPATTENVEKKLKAIGRELDRLDMGLKPAPKSAAATTALGATAKSKPKAKNTPKTKSRKPEPKPKSERKRRGARASEVKRAKETKKTKDKKVKGPKKEDDETTALKKKMHSASWQRHGWTWQVWLPAPSLPFTFFSGLQQPCFFPIHFLLRSTATHGQPRSCVVAAALSARLLGGKKEGRGLALLIMWKLCVAQNEHQFLSLCLLSKRGYNAGISRI